MTPGLWLVVGIFIFVGITAYIAQKWAETRLRRLREKERSLMNSRTILDTAWQRVADAQGVTVEELKRGLEERVATTMAQMAAERGITVDEMRRQITASAMLFAGGPACITVDEFQALTEGKGLDPDRAAHVEGCRNCTRVRETLRGEGC